MKTMSIASGCNPRLPRAGSLILGPWASINLRVRFPPTLFVLTLLLLGCRHLDYSEKQMADADIAKKMIGTWRTEGTSPNGVSASGTVSILRDGSLACNTGFVRGERQVQIAYTGTWKVEKGFLIETVKTTSNSNLLAVGFVTRDKVLRLNEDKLVFEMENGNVVTRERAK